MHVAHSSFFKFYFYFYGGGGGGEKGEGVCVFWGVFLTRISQAFTPRRHFEGRTFFFFLFFFFFFLRGGGGGGGGRRGEWCVYLTRISQPFTRRRHLEGRTLEANVDLPTSLAVVISEKKKAFCKATVSLNTNG